MHMDVLDSSYQTDFLVKQTSENCVLLLFVLESPQVLDIARSENC